GAEVRVRAALADPELAPLLAELSIHKPEDVLGAFLTEVHASGLARDVSPVCDDRPELEFAVARSLMFLRVNLAQGADACAQLASHLIAPDAFTGPVDDACRRRLALRPALLGATAARLQQ